MASITVYPVAGANSPCDGLADSYDYNYTTCHDATVAVNVARATDDDFWCTRHDNASTPTYAITRGIFNFDTSAVGSGSTIDSAVLSIYGSGTTFLDTGGESLVIVSATPASTSNVVLADYNKAKFGTTSFNTLDVTSWSRTGYNDLTLNAAGIANVNKTGITTYGTRTDKDISATTPTGRTYVGSFFADHVGTDHDPKLVITYSATTVSDAPFFGVNF